MDFIMNGQANGSVAQILMQSGFNANALRPYSIDGKGTYITVNEGGKQVPRLISNATALLRKDDWIHLDTAILKVAKPRLKLVAELRRRGLTYNIPNGMGTTVLQTESQSDINEAEVSMNGLRESSNDRPTFDITNLPLPIVHKDFHINLRELQASRSGGSPLDTTSAELASRRVAETVEKLAIGSYGSYSFGGGTLYGAINYPSRLTHTITSPEATAWTGKTLVQDVLTMRQKSTDAFHYGPWMLFNSPAWDQYLDEDYSDSKGDNTLRERLEKINGIEGVMTLDYLTGYNLVLVQLTPEVIREVIGMDTTTLQWETNGGLLLHFKVMTIQVPQLRADQAGNTGIVHGAPA